MKPNSKDPATGSRSKVDLGEDLLAEDAQADPGANSSSSESEELQRGEILMGERLFEDAKKVFRRILRKDPHHLRAKASLEQILEQEAKELLGNESARKNRLYSNEALADTPSVVLERLEKELEINLERSELRAVPDLFATEGEMDLYKEKVLKIVVSLEVRDRIDMGIAHLEMGLFEVAQAIFESVMRYEEYRNVGTYLLGLSLIYGGKAIEATIRIEPLARDISLPETQKADFLYLMGLAFEHLSDVSKARDFYRRVQILNPKYRDVTEKLAR
ncbi:MAG: tetratricopeptide repeat protein [Bdellovibrionota bacterium]